ncbi:GumC family protein [Aureimonas sp. SK2]|uniref:GumC family protein n=1 Tax=Aureimonas sp. SK2 TaxID=3015992 RepID=UPI002444A2C6|nr:GNVR domain-containing protein [Aureimonas sp. SK2]
MFYAEDAASRPASRWDPAPVEGAARHRESFLDPAYLAGAVWRSRGRILFLGILGAVAAGAIAMSQPKQYTATAQIVLDPRELNLVQNEVTPTANGLNTDAALALVESQIAVMTSNSVLLRVVREADLTSDTEFNGLRQSWLGNLSAVVAALMSDDPVSAAESRELRTVSNLWRHITAVRNANSFVINVSVKSEDPEKAARLANLTTQTFIAEQGRAQSDLARRATTALSSRLAELRARVVEAEDAAEAYKAQNQLVGVGGRLIDDDFITRVNTQLADVRSQITALNVRARSLREASVEDIAAGSFPEGLTSESLLRLRQVFSEAAQNQAILASRLGPRHPQRIAADQAVATARRAIETELSRIVASAQTELARAQATERDLTSQIDTLRSRQIETSGAFVRLRELEREVDASRAVYEAYLLRARQTGEQESLNTTNVRVISDATVPFSPSSLSRKLVVVLGFVGGIALGVALALLVAAIRAVRGVAVPATAAAARPVARAARPLAPVPAQADYDIPPAVPAAPDRAPIEAPALDVGEGAWSLRGGSFEPPETRGPVEEPEASPADRPLEAATEEAETAVDASPMAEDQAAHDDVPVAEEVGEAEIAAVETRDSEPASAESSAGEPTVAAETAEADTETSSPVADMPPPAAAEIPAEIEARREALRQRIRDLGARRSGNALAAPEIAPVSLGDTGSAEERRERISLRLAAARNRRAAAVQAQAQADDDL